MDHSINLTHDGTLILRIPKGYQADKVVVEEMGTENRVEYQPTRPTPSNTLDALDCVERQAAIDEIDEWIKAFRENGHKESAADACLIQDGIIQLPSAQPRKGKWMNRRLLYMDVHMATCDQCEKRVVVGDFCPNCGSYNGGDDE